MLRYMHTLSAILFYILGSSMFGAYLLHRNGVWADGTMQWMLSAMLPLLVCGLMYGGLSLYTSVQSTSGRSTGLATVLAVVSLLIFSIFAILTFWR